MRRATAYAIISLVASVLGVLYLLDVVQPTLQGTAAGLMFTIAAVTGLASRTPRS